MILKYKPDGNDQRVNPNIKGMIAFLPSLIQVISKSKNTKEGLKQSCLDYNNVRLDSIRFSPIKHCTGNGRQNRLRHWISQTFVHFLVT